MRVALISDQLTIEKGTGIARYCQEMALGLARTGCDVGQIYAKARSAPLCSVIAHTVELPWYTLRKAKHFDLVHATTPVTGLFFPFIKKPKVITYHDMTSMLSEHSGSLPHVKLFAPLFFRIGKFCNRIIANSTQTKQELVFFMGFPKNKISVVNLGISNKFRPLPKKERDHYVVGYLGALTPRKRVDRLLIAFSLLKKRHPRLRVRLLICGGSSPKQRLELAEMAHRLNLDHSIGIKDQVPDEKLCETYNMFDVFVHPSEWEGFGLPILEAQRCEVPVVMWANARIPSEVSRCCIKGGSDAEIADKMYTLLTDVQIRKKIAGKARKYSLQFTWERTIAETLRVYRDIFSSKS